MKASGDELKRRREKRMSDPVYREIVKRAARWRWKRRKDEVNARKRAEWAALPEEEKEARREKRRAYERSRADDIRKKARERRMRYYDAHRDEIRARQAAYYESRKSDPGFIARRDRNNALYLERCRTDASKRAERAETTRKWRKSPKGLAAEERRRIAKWTSVAEGGPDRIAKYMKIVRPEIRHAFAKWYQGWRGLIDVKKGLGRIVQREDENVGDA